MRKNITLTLLALSVFVIACQKKHTCECTLVDLSTNKTSTQIDETRMSKKDAKAWCAGHGAGTGYKISCTLK